MTVTAIRPGLRAAACIAPKTGLVGYKAHRCRCAGCTEANREYQARRARLKAYGRWEARSDAEPVRAHLRALGEYGIGAFRAADLAGVAHGVVTRVLYGAGGWPPAKWVRPETAKAILAVKPSPDLLADGAFIDATRTRRQIQALAALGWSLTYQARRLGQAPQRVRQLATTKAVTVRVARAVGALYDELSTTPAPPGPTTTRTRNLAARYGWAPPLAWDDETISDPNARPNLGDATVEVVDPVAARRALDGERIQLNDGERAYAIRLGLDRGMSLTAIAQILHISFTSASRLAPPGWESQAVPRAA